MLLDAGSDGSQQVFREDVLADLLAKELVFNEHVQSASSQDREEPSAYRALVLVAVADEYTFPHGWIPD